MTGSFSSFNCISVISVWKDNNERPCAIEHRVTVGPAVGGNLSNSKKGGAIKPRSLPHSFSL